MSKEEPNSGYDHCILVKVNVNKINIKNLELLVIYNRSGGQPTL